MTLTTDALIPALEDAREAHDAVIDRIRSDMAVTPVGQHRQTLERHAADAQDHIARINDHVSDIRPRRMPAEIVQTVAGGALRAAMLPIEIGALIVRRLLRGQHQATEHQLLKNTEDEYTAAARALAVCRAGESIATLAQDEEAATLLAALRRQDEQLLRTLESSVDEHALALATAAANGSHHAQGDGGLAGAAARTVRTAVDRLRHATQSGGQQTARTAAGAAREMSNVTRMAEQVQGAVTRKEDLPIPGYGQLTAAEITQRLRTLSQTDLIVIEGYERAHTHRAGIIHAIEDLRGNQPWPDYDTMSPDQINARLQTADPLLARQVLNYEQHHRQRHEIANAAKQQAGTTTG
jgi:hypothetical protein